ncbi:MAG: hypothetical protein J6B32_00950 [Spirochaetaceae bacterium]|nr:hypothetical protein [Spirochaetaceae bacterium]
MNTIPLTFNQRQIQCTVLGGTKEIPSVRLPISVILLNIRSSGAYKVKLLENLVNNGFESIVSIDKTGENYNVEDFTHQFPYIKFIVPQEQCSIGDMINLGMSEVSSENVLVINDSIHISNSIISLNVIEHYVTGENLCITPRLVNSFRQALPVRSIPSVENNSFKPLSCPVIGDLNHNLYPFDFIGIYNRKKFIRLGGYDYTITTPYWQNLDFSLRAWLWGETIVLSPVFQLAYDDIIPVEDSTADQHQLRFFLKNCAPKYSVDRCYIPISRFFNYKKRANSSFSDTYKNFKEARHWVEQNKYRFKKDISMLINTWGESQT